ncbi:helix-turn-helix transcriptional regulator [Aerococcus christensenii]|uniref:helix-turn-helix transcriptional regulator n=1 Tax=Aerococcus christensenii TaxID=87541 RepID=UPI000762EF58|nr:transcriptional regulator [Aerococcus christensenii]AMB92981.1 hypothetical protein AWM71_06710 [Aerococcus christensenii]DAV16373.1 MAG TPA: putative transcriptional regulator [Caudoviricetes sp.]
MQMVKPMRKFMGLTQSDMAKKLNISRQSYYLKENEKTPFTDKEKAVIKKTFNAAFPNATIDDIFFSTNVSKVEIY